MAHTLVFETKSNGKSQEHSITNVSKTSEDITDILDMLFMDMFDERHAEIGEEEDFEDIMDDVYVSHPKNGVAYMTYNYSQNMYLVVDTSVAPFTTWDIDTHTLSDIAYLDIALAIYNDDNFTGDIKNALVSSKYRKRGSFDINNIYNISDIIKNDDGGMTIKVTEVPTGMVDEWTISSYYGVAEPWNGRKYLLASYDSIGDMLINMDIA